MKNIRTQFRSLFLLGLCITLFPSFAAADQLTSNAFVVRPAKVELSIDRGASETRSISIDNTTPTPLDISIDFVDVDPKSFSASSEVPVTLVTGVDEQNSLKKYVSYSKKKLLLISGEHAEIPVTVSIPNTESPGGKFGALVITATPMSKLIDRSQVVNFSNQIAVLFYTRINGTTKEDGKLVDFSLLGAKRFVPAPSSEASLNFLITYQNSGDVHENPYGRITIASFFGDDKFVRIEPWAVYPGATRSREVVFIEDLSVGYYHATLELNRGYGDIVDTKEVWFVVTPDGIGWSWVVLVVFSFIYLLRRSLRLSRNTVG